MDEVLQLMLAVARFDPSDVEAQVVLGVLQNVTQDLEAAVGAFQTALQRNPQDFGLLNKVSSLTLTTYSLLLTHPLPYSFIHNRDLPTQSHIYS